jgi:hypothetical protein
VAIRCLRYLSFSKTPQRSRLSYKRRSKTLSIYSGPRRNSSAEAQVPHRCKYIICSSLPAKPYNFTDRLLIFISLIAAGLSAIGLSILLPFFTLPKLISSLSRTQHLEQRILHVGTSPFKGEKRHVWMWIEKLRQPRIAVLSAAYIQSVATCSLFLGAAWQHFAALGTSVVVSRLFNGSVEATVGVLAVFFGWIAVALAFLAFVGLIKLAKRVPGGPKKPVDVTIPLMRLSSGRLSNSQLSDLAF